MTTLGQDTDTAVKQPRRDAGVLRITQRDIDGFVLCAEHYGAPYDLLGPALRTSESAAKVLVYRWRRAGYVATARLGPGPWWCWLTKEGMSATGLRYPTGRPPLSRLEHIRAASLLARGAGVLRLRRHDLPAFPLSDKPRITAYPEIRDV